MHFRVHPYPIWPSRGSLFYLVLLPALAAAAVAVAALAAAAAVDTAFS